MKQHEEKAKALIMLTDGDKDRAINIADEFSYHNFWEREYWIMKRKLNSYRNRLQI